MEPSELAQLQPHLKFWYLMPLALLVTILLKDDEQVFSLIVFVCDPTFKTEMPENATGNEEYAYFIKTQTEHRLSDSGVKEVVEKIESCRPGNSHRIHRERVVYVKIVALKEGQSWCLKCPGEIVKQMLKRGKYAGKELPV